ncbi:ankyrin repeat-containing domain protein [Terfezia claveryi]|nr:ankyrin repeat-containing domain protein [Terfezia claveryi]
MSEIQDSLARASEFGELEIVRLLIDMTDPDVSAPARCGGTPIHFATVHEHREITKLLIVRGANVSAAEEGGTTPLHIASLYRHQDIAQLLIDREANVSTARER